MKTFFPENLYPMRCEAISSGSPQLDRLVPSNGVLSFVVKFPSLINSKI